MGRQVRARLVLAIAMLAAIAAGAGYTAGRASATCPPCARDAYADMEREIADLQCRAERARDVIAERVRLTGRVNP